MGGDPAPNLGHRNKRRKETMSMRQRIGRRLISIMLSVLMLVSLLPTAVFAEELQNQTTAGVTEQVGEGTGNTVEDSNENEDSTGGEKLRARAVRLMSLR